MYTFFQTYFGVDVDSIEDVVRRKAVKTMIKTYGQTPKQLFNTPHPLMQGTGFPGIKGFEKQGTSHKDSPKSPLAVRLLFRSRWTTCNISY